VSELGRSWDAFAQRRRHLMRELLPENRTVT